MDVDYLDALKGLSTTRHVSSKFGFLNAHNGLRNGKLHVMMGSSHSGKSTLLRSLLFDALDNNPDKKIFIFLTEESENDFLKELAVSGYRNQDGLDRLKILCAYDQKRLPSLADLIFYLKETEPDIFFFDNITTCNFYADASVKAQGDIVYNLKALAKEMDIPFYIVVHTGAEVVDNMRRMIEMNDIRGSKQIVNMAEFFYIAQGFVSSIWDSLLKKNKEIKRLTIFIKKHRGENCRSRIFYLEYNDQKRLYEKDMEIDFKQFKNYFKDRNHL